MDPDMDMKRQQSTDNTVVSMNMSENNPHHINLINQIISLYGMETLDEIYDIEKIRVKIKRRVADYSKLFSSF